MSLERVGYWLCLAILSGHAGLLSANITLAVISGTVRDYSKHSSGREYVFAQDPVGFCTTLVLHMLVAGAVWYFAYWIWWNRLRK